MLVNDSLSQPDFQSNLSTNVQNSAPDTPRTRILDGYALRLDAAIIALENYWSFVRDARLQVPAAVDGVALVNLENTAREKMEALIQEMDTVGFEDVLEAITGRRGLYWHLRRDIDNRKNRPMIEAEIAAERAFNPAVAAELETYLAETWPL